MKKLLLVPTLLACATAYGQATDPDGAPLGWHAAYNAAQARIVGCVQSQRSPQWAEFSTPPEDKVAYDAWAQRFTLVIKRVGAQCRSQEAEAAAAVCSLMMVDKYMTHPVDGESPCQVWFNSIVSNVMTGRLVCGAAHCVLNGKVD
jgi:hypothetical protein